MRRGSRRSSNALSSPSGLGKQQLCEPGRETSETANFNSRPTSASSYYKNLKR